MTKHLLAAALLAAGTQTASAQCTPDPLYADSVYGVWPDTITDFAPGVLNVFYSDTLNLLVPSDAGLINPGFAGFTIDSVQFTGVTNLPPGLSVVCNSQTSASCTYLTSNVGCGLIEGTPTTAGTYDMTLNVLAYVSLLGQPVPVPQSFDGYTIIIAPSVGVDELEAGLGQVQNVPNPFSQRTSIEFTLQYGVNTEVEVYNLLGERVWRAAVDGRPGLNRVGFEASDMPDGIYLYKVHAGREGFTGRMVLRR
ncbi:MAG: T9SS type A sorting domain-containing protein [Flavobacteriales bacterium]|nr:T9SS type A sorting domain-containing protein [Flavobacteriales bacterium]